jgi:hypothetical protein
MMEPEVKGDLDNIFKCLADCFEPVKKKIAVYKEDGSPELTKKENQKYSLMEISPGVIVNDKFIKRGGQVWVPVHNKKEERLEVYVSFLTEEELFTPTLPPTEQVIELPF